MSPAVPGKDAGGFPEMGFWEHVEALRGALLRSAAAVVALALLCFVFAARLQDLLVAPYAAAAARLGPEAGSLALLSPTEGFLVRMKLAFLGGLLLGSPVVFFQLWGFVSPALHAREKRWVLPVTGAASLLFLAGAAFGWLVLGVATEFLLAFATPMIGNQWSLSSYVTFGAQVIFGLGLVFQLPLVILLLVRLGLVATRQLAAWRRHAAVAILVAVALLPMQDPVSLVLMAAPLYLLYELSILAGRVLERSLARRGAPVRPARQDRENPGGDPH